MTGQLPREVAGLRAEAPAAGVLTLAQVAETVAWSLYEDLWRVIEARPTELGRSLDAPSSQPADVEFLELLCDDIAHLVREGLVQGVDVLICRPDTDGADVDEVHLVLRRATYGVEPAARSAAASRRDRGGLLEPADAASGQLAVLLHWRPDAGADRRESAVPPSYHLTWAAPNGRCDPTTLVRYRDGSLAGPGAAIARPGDEVVPAAICYLNER